MKRKTNFSFHVSTLFIGLLSSAGDWPILLAVRRGLTQVLPLILVGAFALLLLNLPFPQIKTVLDAVAGENWYNLCQVIQQGSFGIASLAVLISISLAYAKQRRDISAGHRVNSTATTVVCLSAYFVVAVPLNGSIPPGFFSLGGGLPLALCVAVTSGPLFVFLSDHSPFTRYLESVGSDPEVNNALAAIPSGFATIFFFGLVRILMENAGWGDLHLQAQNFFCSPFKDAGNSLATGVGYVGLSQLLWFFGVHGPNLLFGVEQDLLRVASQANIEAAVHGSEPIFILTKPFIDSFVHIGGSGSTLSLLLAIFFKSREKNIRRLAVISLLPALFNVNEVILFGLPLVLNPIYAIPFMLAPVLQTLVAYAGTALHLVPMTVNNVHWTSPILLGGFAATGSVAGALLQAVCLGIGTLVYLPFVVLSNSLYARRFNKEIKDLGAAADSTATSPNGSKCIDLPGQTGLFARVLAADLGRALDRDDQIFLVYQPQVDVDLGRIVGAEALLRWKHPVHGLIPPHVTVALAEDTHLMADLGMRVLSDACMHHSVLLDQGETDQILSVNMSAQQFEDEFIVEKVVEILRKTGVKTNMLKVEVTESMTLRPDVKTISILKRLRAMGVRVAIDDFGMGHTSLRYLKEFPVDTVKIDRSLTPESPDGINDHIVTSIVSLCEALGVQIIVEGVETEEQLERFRAHRCSLFQGYLFSKPISGEAYVDLLRKQLK